jgi:hypothetical protein
LGRWSLRRKPSALHRQIIGSASCRGTPIGRFHPLAFAANWGTKEMYKIYLSAVAGFLAMCASAAAYAVHL